MTARRPASIRQDGLAAVVVNVARVGDLDRLRRQCEQAAAAGGWPHPMVLVTASDDPGPGAARRALAAGAALVVAVGGDGTVGACAAALAGTSVPLAIVPAGSANLTAHALRIPARRLDALRVAFSGTDRRIDIGTADGVVFTSMAGIGLDAAVVGAAAAGPAKRLAGWAGYALAAFSQLVRRAVTFTIRLDGGEPLTRTAVSVTVGNTGALPGSFAVMPGARVDDGILDVVVLSPASPVGWADIGWRVAVGSHRDDRHLERLRARTVEISADAELPRQVDGELVASSSSLSVQVEPGALLVRVPRDGRGGSASPRAGSRSGRADRRRGPGSWPDRY